MHAGAAAHGGSPVILGVWDEDKLIAGTSFVEISRGGLKKATTPLLTPYGGFIYADELAGEYADNESLKLLCAEKLIGYLQKNYDNVFLVHTPGFSDIRPFSWQGWGERVRYTYLVDITDRDLAAKRLRSRAKRKIKKAAETVEIGGGITAEQVGRLYVRIFRDRDRIPPVSEDMVTTLVGNLLKFDWIEMITAREKNGDVIALQLLVLDKKTVYTWIYGTLPEKNYSGADSLLIWKAAERYAGEYSTLDLVGANIPEIAFFKKGFGGILTPHYVTEYYSSAMTRTAFGVYSFVKGLVKK